MAAVQNLYTKDIISNIISREQWWRSGETTRLPPMWPGFGFQTRGHMWVEFVSSFLKGFPGYSGFALSSKNLHLIQFDLINLICTHDPTSFEL